MSFAQDNGYTPVSFDEVIGALREAINAAFGTDYTTESFVGTNFYKFFYPIVQELIKNETKTAEVFARLKDYIASTNQKIQRPSVSLPGLIDSMTAQGFVASVKKPVAEDAGTVSICVDLDDGAEDYAAKKAQVCALLKDFIVGGMVFTGTETESITLTNGQEFDFSFHLPEKTPVLLRLTLTSSNNQEVTIPDDEDIRQVVFDNINARYRLGWDFEPQRYYTQVDAPWTATILLEWSDNDGSDWSSEVFAAEFDDLYTFDLEDIGVVIDPPPPEP